MNNEGNESFTEAQLLRMKAEAKLKLKLKQTGNVELESDVKRLLHELQVHQIELEMQNEDLRIANELTELALKKFTMLYDLAPMGFFSIDQNGKICELNFTGAELLGERRFSLINSNIKLYVSDESKETFNDFLSKVFSSNYKESCEIQLGYDKKTLNRVYMEGVVTGDDTNCLLSAVDISNFRK
jgi:PAS domain-containing protein